MRILGTVPLQDGRRRVGWGVDDENSREFLARRYVERFIGCVENVTNPGCTLSPKEKKAMIKEMLKNPTLGESLKIAKPRSSYMKLMLVPYKMGSASLIYLESKFITFVKRRNTKLFAKLKAGR